MVKLLAATVLGLSQQDLKTLMWCVIAGICIALFVTFINKAVTGSIVKALFDNEAFDDYSAKSPKELGYLENSMAYISFKKSEIIKKIIAFSYENPDATEITLETKLYIKLEAKKRAQEQFVLKKDEIITIFVGIFAALAIGFIVTLIAF
ncbi:MAG: hypothetical protein MJ189_04700 [Coriobacteriales bacterium]|nr:hypothetical protein [Coriobacteriales bacterium]